MAKRPRSGAPEEDVALHLAAEVRLRARDRRGRRGRLRDLVMADALRPPAVAGQSCKRGLLLPREEKADQEGRARHAARGSATTAVAAAASAAWCRTTGVPCMSRTLTSQPGRCAAPQDRQHLGRRSGRHGPRSGPACARSSHTRKRPRISERPRGIEQSCCASIKGERGRGLDLVQTPSLARREGGVHHALRRCRRSCIGW